MKLFGRPLSVLAFIGLVLVALNIFLAVFASWIAPHDAGEIVGDVWALPHSGAWLGHDNLGRDLLARLIHGGQLTIGAAVAATIFSYVVGCLLGIVAALTGRWVDLTISRGADVMLAIPTLIFALTLLTVFQGTIALIVTIGLLMAPRVFRFARAIAVDIVAMEYIEVARLRGERTGWIVLREILPNALPGLTAEFGLRICFAVLFISSLSFLGFGVQPPQADWGAMVRENALVISFGGFAPLYPAMAIAQLTVGVNLVVDWILAARTAETEVIR